MTRTPAGKLQLHILSASRRSSGNVFENESWPVYNGPAAKGNVSGDRTLWSPSNATVGHLHVNDAAATLGVSRQR